MSWRLKSLAELSKYDLNGLSAQVQRATPKPTKYNAHRFEADGIKWDSKLEYAHYLVLRQEESAHQIFDLSVHQPFGLLASDGETKVAAIEIDFVFWTADGDFHAEDTKSAATRRLPTYRLKKRLFEIQYGTKIVEILRAGVRP